MSDPSPFETMSPEARAAFCREVMESLSDLVEGEAPAEFCARVADLMRDCPPLIAYQSTLETTIALARECGDAPPPGDPRLHDEALEACLQKVRARLQE